MKRFLRSLVRATGVFALLAAFPLLGTSARADVVILRTGDKVVGLVKDMPSNPDKVLLITASGQVEIPRKQILQRTKEPASTGYRRIAQEYMNGGQWNLALQTLEKASEEEPHDPEVPGLLAEVRKKMVQEGLSKIEAQASLNRQRLNEVEDLIANKDFEKAQNLLDSVQATSPTSQLLTRWTHLTASLQVAWGLDREDKLDTAGAASHFKQALVYEPQNQTAMDHLLNLWAGDPTHRKDVIAGYKRKLEEDPKDLLAARKLADLYLSSGEVATALPYLQKVVDSGKFSNLGYGKRLSNAYATLAGNAAQKKDYAKAIALYTDFLNRVPGADPQPLYYYQYLQRYAKLEPSDFNGKADLAEFLKSKGLDAQAKEDITNILDQDPKNQKALDLLKDYAQQDLGEVQQDFQQGRYEMAMAGAQKLTTSYTNLPDIVEKASDIYARAEIEAKRAERDRQNRARDLVTLGDQYYQQAYFYANQMKSNQQNPDVRVVSNRHEAIKYARRGIEAYKQALQINPNAGTLSGGDLNFKIRDLNQLLNSLTAPPIPFQHITGQYGVTRP